LCPKRDFTSDCHICVALSIGGCVTPDAVTSCVIFPRVRQSNKHQAETRDVHTIPTETGEGVLKHTPRKPATAFPTLLSNIISLGLWAGEGVEGRRRRGRGRKDVGRVWCGTATNSLSMFTLFPERPWCVVIRIFWMYENVRHVSKTKHTNHTWPLN
jgi:hypothetical protein